MSKKTTPENVRAALTHLLEVQAGHCKAVPVVMDEAVAVVTEARNDDDVCNILTHGLNLKARDEERELVRAEASRKPLAGKGAAKK